MQRTQEELKRVQVVDHGHQERLHLFQIMLVKKLNEATTVSISETLKIRNWAWSRRSEASDRSISSIVTDAIVIENHGFV